MVFVLGTDCEHLAIASLLNARQVGARGTASHGLGLSIPPFGFNTPGAYPPSTTSLLILGVLYCTTNFGGCLIIGNVRTSYFGDCLLLEIAWIFCLPGVRIGRSAPMTDRLQFGFSSSNERIKKRMRCRCRLSHLSFFLSGLHWHISGLSEVPLEQLSLLCRRIFSLFSLLKKSIIFPNFCCWGLLKKIQACCRPVSTANTKQQGTISPAHHQRASTCRPKADNASKQTELARASMSSSIYTARYVLKTNRSIEICPAKNTATHKAADAGVIREGLAFITNLSKT